MTVAPTDLLSLRSLLLETTGLTGSSIGIVGDVAHAARGGYHMGKPEVSLGSDYSTTLAPDKAGLSTAASAMDIGYRWPRGGNAAWLQFNNALAAALPNNPTLNPIRAINYSPDGTVKRRIDRQTTPPWAVHSTTDDVDIHTHIEFYRNTEGRRAACLAMLARMAELAVAPARVPEPAPEEEEVASKFLSVDANHQYYLCDGVSSVAITSQRADLLAYLATESSGAALSLGRSKDGADNAEWTSIGGKHGIVRIGWMPAYGPVVADNGGATTVSLTPEQITALAAQISAEIEAGATEEQITALLNQTKLSLTVEGK